ncbi:hypothetical protein DW955_12335 [Ruminococcus sp. AM45-9BH]|nr:hypothetical protein DW955_12335 [Ruminococcus sp. AM45-9BH]
MQSVDQIKKIYTGDTWGILMDACSAFIFLGSGRGSLNTQEYVSKLLGQATIDKRTEGESRGKSGNSSLNFDRAGRDLMTPAEIGRMSRENVSSFWRDSSQSWMIKCVRSQIRYSCMQRAWEDTKIL